MCGSVSSFKKIGLICCLLAVCCLLTSCSSKQEDINKVSLWTGMDAEYPRLVELCDKFTAQTGIKVELLKVPFRELRNKYFVAAPAGVGPDLLLGAHDWIGAMQIADLIAPIPEDFSYDDFTDVARRAANYERKMYMVPLCMDTLALFRNKELMPERPATMEDMLEQAVAIQKNSIDASGRPTLNGFYYEIKEAYFSIPFLTMNGAYLLGEKDGVYDPTDVGLGNEGAIKGAEFLRSLRDPNQYGLIKAGCSESISRTLFYDGTAAIIVNGPWILQDLKNRNNDPNKKHIDYVVDPFPVCRNGNEPRSIVGMQGLMLSNFCRNRENAMKLIEFLAETEQMLAISESSGRPPVTNSALARITDNVDISTFADVCLSGIPMPSHPACQQIWEPAKQSFELIANGEVKASEEMPNLTARIKQNIKLMME